MKLYHHKTSGGAEYLTDTFIKCKGGHKEGHVNSETKYCVRIDGDITKDAEISGHAVNSYEELLNCCTDTLRVLNLNPTNDNLYQRNKIEHALKLQTT